MSFVELGNSNKRFHCVLRFGHYNRYYCKLEVILPLVLLKKMSINFFI